MTNNPKILKKLLEKIKNTPDDIFEEAIDSLSETMMAEEYMYKLDISIKYNDEYYYNNFYLERENEEWKKESLQLTAA